LFPGKNPEDLDIKDSMVFVKANPENKQSVAAVVGRATVMYPNLGSHTSPPFGIGFSGNGIYGESRDRPELSRMGHFGEIEVDPETGLITVKKAVFVNDVGRAFSPETVEGQQYGAGIMGLSRALMEENVYDLSTGVCLNEIGRAHV
jgi:CO/xanthine dehydrogenase Mo-binding subunit